MATVIATIKVMPTDIDIDLDKLSKDIESLGGKNIVKKPIAFGLNSLECVFSVPDGEGGTQNVEDSIAKLSGVGEVQVIALGREIDASDL